MTELEKKLIKKTSKVTVVRTAAVAVKPHIKQKSMIAAAAVMLKDKRSVSRPRPKAAK